MTDQIVEENAEGPGGSPVGTVGIAVLAAYLLGLSAALLYCLIVLWPHSTSYESALSGETKARYQEVADTSQGANAPDPPLATIAKAIGSAGPSAGLRQLDPSDVGFVAWKFKVSEETRLFLLVVCAGALGSLVHGLRSCYWYVGNQELILSWMPKYFIQPFGASVLAVVFYLVIRGGFFSADAGSQHTSPFGFVALSAMVGMFSEQAVLKLKEIAETLLSKPPTGKDREQENRQLKTPSPPASPGQTPKGDTTP
jgi:hypothetical protein